jgi:hypothetical protein
LAIELKNLLSFGFRGGWAGSMPLGFGGRSHDRPQQNRGLAEYYPGLGVKLLSILPGIAGLASQWSAAGAGTGRVMTKQARHDKHVIVAIK